MKRFLCLFAMLAALGLLAAPAAAQEGAPPGDEAAEKPADEAAPSDGGEAAPAEDSGGKPADGTPGAAEPAEGEKPAEGTPAEGEEPAGEEAAKQPGAEEPGRGPDPDEEELRGEHHRAVLGADGFADVFYADGTRLQMPESTEVSFFVPAEGAKQERFFALLRGAATLTLAASPVSLKLPVGDAVLWGEGAVATLQVSRDEKAGDASVQVTNAAPKEKLHLLVGGKQIEVGPGKSFRLSAGALGTIAAAGTVVPPESPEPATRTDTFHYHVGTEGSLSVHFPLNQRLEAGQKADATLALDRRDPDVKGLVVLRTGFFQARLKGRFFRLKTPSNRILINGASFWARIDPSGEWDRIHHTAGKPLTLESLKVDGFSINVPLKGGADVIHPKDTRVVLLSVHRGLPPARPIVIKYGGRVFELPPVGKLEPQPETRLHPEKTGETLFESGAFTVLLYRDGKPLSYRFLTDENDLTLPRGDAFKDAGFTRTVSEASPFLR